MARPWPACADQVRAMNYLGVVLVDTGEHAAALQLHLEALDLARELDDVARVVGLRHSVGALHAVWGEYDAATPLFEESLALSERWAIARAQPRR